MRCLIAILMTLTTLSAARADEVEFCFLFCSVKRPVVSDFCQAYVKVNQGAADSAEIKKLSRGPKSRLTANDVLYLCKCKAWDNPICSK